MPMQLSEKLITEKLLRVGEAKFSLPAGKSLKIETSPNGEEYLNITVGRGKTWEVLVYVSIEETDV